MNISDMATALLNSTASASYIKSTEIKALRNKVKAHMCATATGNQWLGSAQWRARKAVQTLPAHVRQSIQLIALVSDTIGRAIAGALAFKAAKA